MSNKPGGTYCVLKTIAVCPGVHCVPVEMRPVPPKTPRATGKLGSGGPMVNEVIQMKYVCSDH